LVVKDIFGVIYAPHKAFKKIVENPKYLAVAIIILLFVALQTTYYYGFYSKVNYEQTLPPVGQLSAFTTTNATNWDTPSGTIVTENSKNFINQTYYGNNSLQFRLLNSNSLSAKLEQFGYTANCGPDGYTSLSMSIQQTTIYTANRDLQTPAPLANPKSGILTLYTANGTSNYFTLDITSMLTNEHGEWCNLTIPVGTSEWQSTGTPNWTEVTGLQLTLTYPETSDINISLQGIFFRGQYLTQVNALGSGMFFGFAAYSVVLQILFQWVILAIISYVLLKVLKAHNILWRPLFITIGFTLMALVIVSVFALLSSLTLQTIYFPYDFPPYGAIVYPDFIVNSASPSSQITYESIVATTTTYTTLNTIINIFMYVLQVALVTFAIKALSSMPYVKNAELSNTDELSNTETAEATPEIPEVTEFLYTKCLLIAAGAVILSTLIMALLSAIGFF